MVTGVFAVTGDVAAAKVALVAPATTVTLAGTPAVPASLLESDTTAPSGGAADVKVTVPVDWPPPLTLAGLTLTSLRAAGPAVAKCG
jgi:hypothetical protein